MVSKAESIVPPRLHVTTPTGAMFGFLGLTPAVPVVVQAPLVITLRPLGGQVQAAGRVAQELESSSSFGDDFGTHAPAPATLASLLQSAKAYTDEAARAQAWLDYLHEQRDRVWHEALGMMWQFKPCFDLASQCDPNIALRYPATEAFLGARGAVVARSAATLRKRRAAKKNADAPT